MGEQLLKIVDEELSNLHYEMKHLDQQYIEKQKRVRQLKRVKDELSQQVQQANNQ